MIEVMTTSGTELRSRWTAGRIAAAVLFLGGIGWAVTFARWSEFPKVYLPGYVVWILWGLRAAGLNHSRFRNLTWAISTFWHLIWFFFVLWLLPGLFGLVWVAGLQMAWSVIAFVTSVIFWRGNVRRQ